MQIHFYSPAVCVILYVCGIMPGVKRERLVDMIYSHGVDLVEIDRIRNGYNRYRDKFLNRIYSGDEIAIIRSRRAGMVPTMAGKFAGKEAVIKALGAFFDDGVFLRDIEILNDASGSPYVRLPERLLPQLREKKILISISHERVFAMASVIICDDA